MDGELAIDSHVHLYPEEIAAKVVGGLSKRFGNEAAFDGTVGGCAANAAAAGIAASLNLPVATKPDSVRHMNLFWSAYAPKGDKAAQAVESEREKKVGGRSARVFSLAAFHPLVAEKGAEVERIASLGFTGIKLHPEYQLFRFNDAVMDEAWAAMEEFGLVAYLHAGGERVFQPPFHSTPAEIALLQRRFPRLRIVAAHLGGFGMWDESEKELVGTATFLDLSHALGWMDSEQIKRFIARHGAERILFGTDAPWQEPAKVLAAFNSLRLADEARRAILYSNTRELFSLEPL